MRYYVELDKLDNKSNELLKYCQNEINDKIMELEKYKNSFIWEGIGHDSFINLYNDEIIKLKTLKNNMEKISNFVMLFKNNYYDTNSKLDNSWDEYLQEVKKRGDIDEL